MATSVEWPPPSMTCGAEIRERTLEVKRMEEPPWPRGESTGRGASQPRILAPSSEWYSPPDVPCAARAFVPGFERLDAGVRRRPDRRAILDVREHGAWQGRLRPSTEPGAVSIPDSNTAEPWN